MSLRNSDKTCIFDQSERALGPIFILKLNNAWMNDADQLSRGIQLFRQRLSYKSVIAYATMPIGIMGSKSLALLY